MTKHWSSKGKRTQWLSPQAYNALSPAEKRALAFERRKQRHEQRYHPAPRRYRKGRYAGQRHAWLIGVLVLSAVLGQRALRLPSLPFLGPQASAPVSASFGYCKWGGGTNCVVDGDTFWIEGQKVRIADIDAPETHPSRCDDEERLGNAATEKLHSLLNSGAVTMTSIDRDRDVYGRLLRNVAVNGADVGETMVAAGVAREWVGHREPWC